MTFQTLFQIKNYTKISSLKEKNEDQKGNKTTLLFFSKTNILCKKGVVLEKQVNDMQF